MPVPLSTWNALLPVLVASFFPDYSLRPFTPKQVLYFPVAELAPLLWAPWATPTASVSLSLVFSRLIHSAFLYFVPLFSCCVCYALWLANAAMRTLVAWILTRSVGWAYPSLFCHESLYETSSGFGPPLVMYFHLNGLPQTVQQLHVVRGRETFALLLLCCFLSLVEGQPWGYGTAVLTSSALILSQKLYSLWAGSRSNPMSLNPRSDKKPPMIRKIFQNLLLFFLVITLPHTPAFLLPSTAVSFPASPDNSPLLDILVLTFPRPNSAIGSKILESTIASYLPFVDSNVQLSVFTHSTQHPVFQRAKDAFRNESVTFFMDDDIHPDSYQNQYLHLAEAFRWVERRQAHWVMLVEDDFPICEGRAGWSAVAQVIKILESGRTNSNMPHIRGGFVGTGGSGLIIHRSLLQIIMLLLRTHAEIVTKIPQDVARRPPDVIMQDCLLGIEPTCPQRPDGQTLIITSRLVMDHIGGMASTTEGKPGNTDKWRCGWRHPFHGRPQVQVVPVPRFKSSITSVQLADNNHRT